MFTLGCIESMTINEFHLEIDNMRQISVSFLDYVENSSIQDDMRNTPEWQDLIEPYQSKTIDLYCLNDKIVIQAIQIENDQFTNDEKLYLDGFLTDLEAYDQADHYLVFYEFGNDPRFVLVREDNQIKEMTKDEYTNWLKRKAKD